MNEKEVAEIRRRFRYNKGNVSAVRGILVAENGEIACEFKQYLQDLPEDEVNLIYAIGRKTLTGAIGKNLIDVSFTNDQVMYGEEFGLLNTLRESELNDEGALKAFYAKAIENIKMDGAYLLTLCYDAYDVFKKKSDGEKDDESSEVYRYFVCSVCPVKTTQGTLSFYPHENRFRRIAADTVVEAPVFGFTFPAFDDRSCNLYGALLYTKDSADNHEQFADAIFNAPVPMPAEDMKENFNSILTESLDKGCDLKVVKNVQTQVREMVATRKEQKIYDPLTLNKREVEEMLEIAGAEHEQIEEFDKKFDEVFGEDTTLPPLNIVQNKALEVKTEDVAIKIKAERSDLVETRIIDGVRYILIKAEGDVEVNGVKVKIN